MVKRRKQSQSKNTLIWVFAFIAFIAVIGLVLNNTSLSIGDSQGTDVDEQGDVSAQACSLSSAPKLLISATDAEVAGSAITEAGIYRAVGSSAWKAFTPGTEIDASLEVGKIYEFYPGITSTDFLDHAYGEAFEHKVKCLPSESVDIEMFNDAVETALSATFYNEDSNAAAQTVLASENPIVSFKIRASANTVFGNPTAEGNPNALVLRLNSSEWDVPEKVVVEGQTMNKIGSLQRLDGASGYNDFVYEFPVITEDKIEAVLYLDADNTNAPSVDGTAYIYAGGYYVNSETGMVEFGVETQEGAAVATDAADSIVLDFTA